MLKRQNHKFNINSKLAIKMSQIRVISISKIIKKVIVLFLMISFLNLMFLSDSVFAGEREHNFWNSTTVIGVAIVLPIVISIAVILYKKRPRFSKVPLKDHDKKNIMITSKYIENHFTLKGEAVVFKW